jgi:hypothetical protein
MSFYYAPVAENETVVKAALRVVTATHYAREDDPHADADHEHSQEQLALAARALVEAVDKLPEDKQPIGWVRQPCPAALMPLNTDPVEPCVIQGKHHMHRAEAGRTWTDADAELEEANG